MRGELGKRRREKRRTVFGDGSDFRRPGWEEELIDFKKKLRMPSKLIRVSKPSSLSSSPGGRGRDKDKEADQPASGTNEKEKEEIGTPASTSPAKSTKENKSPTKSTTAEESETKKKPKGRPPKTSLKSEEKEKASPSSTPTKGGKKGGSKGKSDTNTKKSDSEPVTDEPLAEKTPEKGKGKSKAKGSRSKSVDKTNKSDTKEKDGTKEPTPSSCEKGSPSKDVKEEREPGMLPTPGPAGAKFNKKMSIKSVFGLDVTPAGSPAPPARKVLRRNKFKSGFDYIRKKKKAAPATPDGSVAPTPPKRPKVRPGLYL
jgi:hypothetical protein